MFGFMIPNDETVLPFIHHVQATRAAMNSWYHVSDPAQLTNLLALKRDELNLKSLVFLSKGLMVNCTFRRHYFTENKPLYSISPSK